MVAIRETVTLKEDTDILIYLLKNKFNLSLFFAISIGLEIFFIYGKMIKNMADYFLFGMIAILAGLVLVTSVHKIRTKKLCNMKEVGGSSSGLVIGVFAQMPVCCAPITLAMFGLTGASLFLTQYGSWLVYLSLLILGFSLFFSIKSLRR